MVSLVSDSRCTEAFGLWARLPPRGGPRRVAVAPRWSQRMGGETGEMMNLMGEMDPQNHTNYL